MNLSAPFVRRPVGTVLLTVFMEELPEARRSRVGWFLGGTATYAALLVAVTVLEGGTGAG